MRERVVRIVPHEAITVAIENSGRGRSYGVVANISEGGACVLTDASFPVGESLQLELSFFREPQVVPATARIVWSSGNPEIGALRYGLQWLPASEGHRLKTLIERAGAV
jgi:c-di-GMP-binding flagellar brake protein YcgR